MKKKWLLLWSFVILLSAGVLYASMIIVWMTGATYYPTPPSVYSSGGGGTLPDMGGVKVTWEYWEYSPFPSDAPSVDLKCNGSTIATDVEPYAGSCVPDEIMGGYVTTGFYKYWDTITSSGTYTYETDFAINSVSVNVP